jgi:hypothetical protein
MALGPAINDAILRMVTWEHCVDPLYRDAFDRLLRRPLAGVVQTLLRWTHDNPETGLCEEIVSEVEGPCAKTIVKLLSEFLRQQYPPGQVQRAGNTKTYGVVRAEFTVGEAPPEFRRGMFAEPRTYPAWIRLSGPGPLAPADAADAGILSIGIKVMGVPGEKLLPDERATQDFLGISCPTFTTPNVGENVKLQRRILAGTPIFYFLNPFDSHLLDLAMQGLYARMNTGPTEVRYWSCVPCLCGPGRAVKYSIRPVSARETRVPIPPPANWLRQSLAATLAERDVELSFELQAQTDPRRMPIEDASIAWSEKLSPFAPVARIRIPKQKFDSPAQLAFADVLSYNPWHTTEDHRPLGNQNRARRLIYSELARFRQGMNHRPHVEPTGAETFA